MNANAAVVHRFFDEVVNQGRIDVVDQLLDPAVIDHNQIVLTEPAGAGSAAEGIRMLLVAFPDLKAEVLTTVSEGDTVVVRFSLAGTNTGAYRYLGQPTGRWAAWEGIGIFRVIDGRVAEIWGTADRMTMLTQLGILPDVA